MEHICQTSKQPRATDVDYHLVMRRESEAQFGTLPGRDLVVVVLVSCRAAVSWIKLKTPLCGSIAASLGNKLSDLHTTINRPRSKLDVKLGQKL